MKFLIPITFILLILLFVIDFIFGNITRINEIRFDRNNFNSSAKSIIPYTKRISSNLYIEVKHPFRPEGEKYKTFNTPLVFCTDSNGYISHSRNISKPATGERILFLGGSTTECYEVDEDFRFPYLVGKILNDKGMSAITYNGGVHGHTTQDSTTSLIFIHRKIRPTKIILMHNINDRSWLKSNGSYQIQNPPNSFISKKNSFYSFFMEHTNIGYGIVSFLIKRNVIDFRFPGDHRPFSKEDQPLFNSEKNEMLFTTKVRPLFRENLRIFISLCRELKAEPILMTQPLGKIERSKEHQEFNIDIIDTAKEMSCRLIDLDDSFIKEPSSSRFFLTDDIHLCNEGSIFTAKVVSSMFK